MFFLISVLGGLGGAAARHPPPLGAPLNKAVNVVDYYSDANLYANKVKPMLATLVPLKAARITQAANLRKPLHSVEIELCTVTCASDIRVRRQVKLESRYIALLINRNLEVQ